MENSHIYVSDSDRQYILAKDDIIKYLNYMVLVLLS